MRATETLEQKLTKILLADALQQRHICTRYREGVFADLYYPEQPRIMYLRINI